jgi:hypothetical protein
MYGSARWSAAIRCIYAQHEWTRSTRLVYAGTNYDTYTGPDGGLSKYRVNAEVNYNITRNLSVFISGSNILNPTSKSRRIDTGNILPSYAQIYQESKTGVAISTGISGSF